MGIGNKLVMLYFANKPGERITSPLVTALFGSDDIRHESQRHILIRPLTPSKPHCLHFTLKGTRLCKRLIKIDQGDGPRLC